MEDKLILGGKSFGSRLMLESGKYDPDLIKACVESTGYEMITVALRRVNADDMKNILNFIPKDVTITPNTSGAKNADGAIRIARLVREMGCGNFVKIEIMRDSEYLLPDNVETLKATKVLANEGFVIIPYMYPGLNFARDLKETGASCIMSLGSPIGSNKGLATRDFIQITVSEIDLPVVVDTGIDRPSQACEAMEMGASAIMANTTVATNGDINKMVEAFVLAIKAGRLAHIAEPDGVLETDADPPSPPRDFFKWVANGRFQIF